MFIYSETSAIYTFSLHAALPICLYSLDSQLTAAQSRLSALRAQAIRLRGERASQPNRDRKATRLNSSYVEISYAVIWLKKTTTMIMGTSRRTVIHFPPF